MIPGEAYHMWRICGFKWTENRSNGAHYQATICWQMNTHTLTSWSTLCKNWCKSFRYKCIKRYGNKQVDVYHYKDKTSWDRVIFIMEIPIPTVLSYDVPTPERVVFYILSRPMTFLILVSNIMAKSLLSIPIHKIYRFIAETIRHVILLIDWIADTFPTKFQSRSNSHDDKNKRKMVGYWYNHEPSFS